MKKKEDISCALSPILSVCSRGHVGGEGSEIREALSDVEVWVSPGALAATLGSVEAEVVQQREGISPYLKLTCVQSTGRCRDTGTHQPSQHPRTYSPPLGRRTHPTPSPPQGG